MTRKDPWELIRRTQRRMKILIGSAFTTLLGGLFFFRIEYFEYWMALVALLFFVLYQTILQPNSPCPQCGKPFLIWAPINSKYQTKLAITHFFNPFAYWAATFISPYCPHCDFPYEAPMESDSDS